MSMTLSDIKKTVANMSLEERLELAAFLAHLNTVDDPAYQSELDRRMAAMDAGKKTPAHVVEKIHADLTQQGR